jgi:amino acid transporter
MVVLSILMATAFYVLVILAASMTMPWQRLLSLELPAAAAFEAAFDSSFLGDVVLTAAFLGLVTTWHPVFISASRVLFSLSRSRIIHPAFGRVHHRHGSPANAVVFIAMVGVVGVFLGRSAILPIVGISAACLAFAFFLTCVGVFRLRRTRPELVRPYRVPGGVPTALLATVVALFVLVLALYQPFVEAGRRIPTEWVVLVVWGILGVFLWVLARGVRASVTETQRRRLIVGSLGRSPVGDAAA